MFKRRDVVKLCLGGLAAWADFRFWKARLIGTAKADPAPPPPPGFSLSDPTPFHPGNVTDMARAAAKQPFKPLSTDLPNPFRKLSYDQYVDIRAKPSAIIWAGANVGFAIEPLHRGFIFAAPVTISLVANGQARRVVYDTKQFDFGKLAVPPNVGDIGFSGFGVLVPQANKELAEIATFQGASFFRAIGRDQRFGTMARALSIKTADARGEEFPAIRSVWIEQPDLATDALVIHAFIDSESTAGAYRFTLHPGDSTIIDTECTLFARANVDNLGIATMSATVISDAIDHKRPDDTRLTIADIDGLQMLSGHGEWLWRAVSNRETLQISTFVDENPRGFGFLQRDRSFHDYQDDDQHWESRPSLWIQPIGDWGKGGIELIEIPGEAESNDNIIAYWRPQQTLNAGSETSFAYRQFWCWNPPDRPALATATDTRSGRAPDPKHRRFLVEFQGDVLGDAAQIAATKAVLTTNPGNIVFSTPYAYPSLKTFRLLFELDPGNATACELRLMLQAGGNPLSETWLYRWNR
jgi:periplasmic glucans biosynthesis protein